MGTNVLSPTGLVFSRNLLGAAPTYQANVFKIKKGYATAIGLGDVVKTGTSGNQGYIVLSADNDTTGLGIFAGFPLPYYDSTLQGYSHGLNGSWPGANANANADVDCLVITDPYAVFRVQASGGPYTTAARGLNINWTASSNGAPNSAGISTLSVSYASAATTNTLPFRVVGVVGVPGGPQDPANTNPWIEVTLNPGWSEQLTATGI